jgi:hypothetical protein
MFHARNSVKCILYFDLHYHQLLLKATASMFFPTHAFDEGEQPPAANGRFHGKVLRLLSRIQPSGPIIRTEDLYLNPRLF